MRVEDADRRLRAAHSDFSRFYGDPAGLDWGVGLVASNVAFPLYDRNVGEFAVAEGIAYIASHECDIDPRNDRPFNDTALICPIIPLQIALDDLNVSRTPEQVVGFVDAVARNLVDRISYIPTIADLLPWGGLLYLNAMSHTNVRELEKENVEKLSAVSEFGLRYIDAALHNTLLKRPKSQALPLRGVIMPRYLEDQGKGKLHSLALKLMRRLKFR